MQINTAGGRKHSEHLSWCYWPLVIQSSPTSTLTISSLLFSMQESFCCILSLISWKGSQSWPCSEPWPWPWLGEGGNSTGGEDEAVESSSLVSMGSLPDSEEPLELQLRFSGSEFQSVLPLPLEFSYSKIRCLSVSGLGWAAGDDWLLAGLQDLGDPGNLHSGLGSFSGLMTVRDSSNHRSAREATRVCGSSCWCSPLSDKPLVSDSLKCLWLVESSSGGGVTYGGPCHGVGPGCGQDCWQDGWPVHLTAEGSRETAMYSHQSSGWAGWVVCG